jgi:hypothetical protein
VREVALVAAGIGLFALWCAPIPEHRKLTVLFLVSAVLLSLLALASG